MVGCEVQSGPRPRVGGEYSEHDVVWLAKTAFETLDRAGHKCAVPHGVSAHGAFPLITFLPGDSSGLGVCAYASRILP